MALCTTAYIIRDHIRSIMQLLTNDLPEYNMQIVTTKCLNTAVMMAYLLLGSDALRHTGQCDVPNVRARHAHSPRTRQDVCAELYEAVLDPADMSHQLFYVMLTDGKMVTPLADAQSMRGGSSSPDARGGRKALRGPVQKGGADGSEPALQCPASSSEGRTETFPGHVFVIERVDGTSFHLYQSYIGQYTLTDHINGSKSAAEGWSERFIMGRGDMQRLLRGLHDHVLVDGRAWSGASSQAWRALTHTTAEHTARFEGLAPCDGTLRPCFQQAPVQGCLDTLRSLVDTHMARLERLRVQGGPQWSSGSYGNPVYLPYGDNRSKPALSATPLTPCEMLQDLTVLRRKIQVGDVWEDAQTTARSDVTCPTRAPIAGQTPTPPAPQSKAGALLGGGGTVRERCSHAGRRSTRRNQ